METKKLALIAKENGICSTGLKRILSSKTKEELIQYYIEGLDFCLEHDFPSKDYLRLNGGTLLAKYGIHVDEKRTLINRARSILLGTCDASISHDGFSVSDIFIKHESNAKVFCSADSFVRIDCFDTVNVRIHASGNAKIVVNVYGSAKVAYEKKEKAQIKIINKGKETY
ncbi:hypothetical protein QT327_10595 [Olivibacter sp. 47]|uniref:hypothetical protein n=1 Tax=Olivibacter sp. 47 TaxID=3056486 RepID=UPI0025A33BB1|nr:hypothetical protein [Olivibacter sp. 47]MDM8174798.1 hypothetical protein [Olivibacter sp. 47]